MVQIKAFRCDECGKLVEKADNLMMLEKRGKAIDASKYTLEIRFFRKKSNGEGKEENNKAVDLCDNCKKFISGSGKLD